MIKGLSLIKKVRFGLGAAAVCAFALLAYVSFMGPVVPEAFRLEGKGMIRPIPSAHLAIAPDGQETAYVLVVERGRWPSSWLQVWADDCITGMSINGQKLEIPQNKHCVYPSTTMLDLSSYLQEGRNTIDIRILNYGGPSGISAAVVPLAPWLMALLKAFALATLFVAALLKPGCKYLTPPVMGLLYLSLLLTFNFYFSTNYYQYTNDILGHMSYVRSLAIRQDIPAPQGWQNQQPPLYYLLTALWYKAGAMLGMADPFYASRLFSLLLYTGFLLLSLLTLRIYFPHGFFVLAAMVVLLWTDGVTYAGRITTDVAMLFLHALVLYLTVRWGKTGGIRFLRYALMVAFAGLAVKGSAVIGIGAVALLWLYVFLRREAGLREVFRWPLLLTAAAAVSVNFGRTFYYRIWLGQDVKWFINLDLSQIPQYLIGNTPYHYFYFDLSTFLKYPYVFSTSDSGDFFWNAFLKTLLFGEWYWQAGNTALLLSALLLIMLAYMIWFIFARIRPENLRLYLPPLVMAGCMVGALIVARIQVPWSAQCNARYIFGIIAIISLFFIKAVETCRREKKLVAAGLGVVVAVSFAAASLAMIFQEERNLWTGM